MMSLFTLIPLSIGLSTDAFAASLARGGRERGANLIKALKSGAVFGTTEGLMCLLGWSAASLFADQIRALDHWIALILLVIIGGRMIRDGLSKDDDDEEETGGSRASGWLGTLVTAIGTSVDSAAVGVALALSSVTAWAALMIGGFSFVASTIGFLIGPMVGERLGKRAEIGGGILLILIGLGIWTSHMFSAG